MLEINVTVDENFDETTNKFVVGSSVKVRLEHSLVSLSKWESIWEVPFLGKKEKTQEQTISYIESMILNEDLPPEVFHKLLEKHLEEIHKYVGAKMTATTINSNKNSAPSREVITSELIYYWMVSMNIPIECEHWHLGRLFMLMQVINLKNTPKKKMSGAEMRNLNRARLAQQGTTG